MKLTIEIEFDNAGELASLLNVRDVPRDELRDTVANLKREPLAFSLEGLARRVMDGITSLTPDQRDKITSLIENG